LTALSDRLLAIEEALRLADIPHAFGGAIALGYCAAEARGTQDLDINLFVPPNRTDDVFAALPEEVAHTDEDMEQAERDAQVRLWWEDTAVDLFFHVHSFHSVVAANTRVVPFLGRQIPVIGCAELVVFKAMYNRTRDWADIEDVLANGVDIDSAVEWLERLREDDEITESLRDLVARS
jgi:hypothetical protein